jgi:hypothetical protein
MKNKKWLNYTLSILLTLIVLTAVAGVGFRTGVAQSTTLTRAMNGARPAFAHEDRGSMSQATLSNFHGNDKPQMMHDDFQQQTSTNSGFDRRDGGFSFLSPVFGLIRLVVLGLLVWLGYTFVKKSGWKLSRVQAAAPTPASPTEEIPSAQVEEKEEE